MQTYARWHFAVVLLAALFLVVIPPLISRPNIERSIYEAFFSILLVAVFLSLFEEKKHRLLVVCLALPALLAPWLSHALQGTAGRVCLAVGYLFAASFFGFALYGILRTILAKKVSGNALLGAVCGYLLLGIIWSLIYSTVETAQPGSLFAGRPHAECISAPSGSRGIYTYYSFVTLTTLGYGDITPVTPFARTLAWLEAMTGQLYLAVLVAGLVGLKVMQAGSGNQTW
jgi:hypothetical protein